MSAKVHPHQARICRDCSNLVTIDAQCPLCDEKTEQHPEREEIGYCQGCAGGPFPIDKLHLVTWNEDPYVQDEDGDLYFLCPRCVSNKGKVDL